MKDNKIDSGEEAPALKQMTDDELSSVCLQEIARGIGGLTNEDSSDVSLALDYYLGRLPGITKRTAKDPGSSRYVSMDVMDGIEATVAEIMPSFSSDEIAFFEPSGQDDEDQAEMESQLCNYLLFEEYDGWTIIQQALKDALLHRNCTVKAYWDERAEVTYEEFENIPAMALPQLLQPNKENQQVEIVHQEVSGGAEGEMDEAPGAITLTDNQFNPMAQETFSIKIRRTTLVGRPVIDGIAPEQVIVNGDHDSPTLFDARFIAHEQVDTVSSLIQQGFDPALVAKLPEYTSNIDQASRSRNASETDYQSAHSSTKMVLVYECYPLVDYDGDGIAERRKVVIGGNGTLLSNDEWDGVPLIGGVAMIMPHKYRGISMFDRLREIQDTKTPLIRSIVDGTQLASNPRLGVLTGEANLDDVMTSRTGGIVRMNRPDAVFPLAPAEIPQSSYSLISFMDGQRRERGGGAVGMADQASKAVGQGGDFSLDRIMSSMELSNAVIAKSIGETLIRGLFIQIHSLIRENHQGEIQAKIGGRWVKGYPQEWQTRANVSVQVGSSQAERQRQAGTLQQVINLQKELAANGSVMFSEAKSYKAISDAIKWQGVKSPERYLTDPSSDEGKQASQQKQQQSQKEKMEQMQVQIAMVKSQMGLAKAENTKAQAQMISQQVKAENDRLTQELNKMKAIIDAADKSDQTEFDYRKLETDAALSLTKLEQEYQVELNKQNEANKLNI